MSDGTPFLRVAADRIGAPGSPAKNCHSAPPTPPIGPQSSGSARRWPSFEGELPVEPFRATLNGLGGFHMGNPGLHHSSPFASAIGAGEEQGSTPVTLYEFERSNSRPGPQSLSVRFDRVTTDRYRGARSRQSRPPTGPNALCRARLGSISRTAASSAASRGGTGRSVTSRAHKAIGTRVASAMSRQRPARSCLDHARNTGLATSFCDRVPARGVSPHFPSDRFA